MRSRWRILQSLMLNETPDSACKKEKKRKKHIDSGAWTLRQILKDRNLKAKKNKYPTYAYSPLLKVARLDFWGLIPSNFEH